MTFEIVADNLARKSEIKSLKLSNEEYKVTIFYMGDYVQDRQNGCCDVSNITVSCKPQNENFSLTFISGEIIVECSVNLLLRPKEIAAYRKLLEVAEEAARELQRILKEYFGIEPE